MNSITSTHSQYDSALQTAANPGSRRRRESTESQSGPDSIQLSPAVRQLLQAGRIALDEKAGLLTSDQATSLYSQVASTQPQIATDKTAGGGTLNAGDAQSIQQLQDQTSQLIYSDAHNGASYSDSQ